MEFSPSFIAFAQPGDMAMVKILCEWMLEEDYDTDLFLDEYP